MKILFVTERYFPFVGGLETQLRLVAQRLARRHRVEVAALSLLDNSGGQCPGAGQTTLRSRLKGYLKGFFSEGSSLLRLKRILEDGFLLPSYQGYREDGVTVHALSPAAHDRLHLLWAGVRLWHAPLWNGKQHERHEGNGRFWHSFYRPLYVPKLRALMRGKDVVHCTADGALGWAVEEAARAEGVPFIFTPYVHPGHHGEDDDNVALYQRADIVFALIETGREALVELGVPRDRIRIAGVVPLLPERVDPAGFRDRHGLGNGPVVLFVGRMVKYKGVAALIEAAPLVWHEIPETQFVFIGPGDASAEKWFTAANDKRLRYLGLVSDQDKGDALAACQVFCMPSVAEILPAVYLEAWSYGKPVIGGTAPGLRELIEGNKAGLVVEQDPAAIAARLCELLRDSSLCRRMGEYGRLLVMERFSEDAVVQAFEQAYESLGNSRSQARPAAGLIASVKAFL